MPERVVLLGTGMFAEELTDLAAAIEGMEVVAYCENLNHSDANRELDGRPVVWVEDLPSLDGVGAVCAITTTERQSYVEQVRALGVRFSRLVHPSAVVAPTAVLGAGVVVGAGAVIGARTVLGDHVIVNRGALIGHHATLGEFATVQPGANVGGATEIGPRAYVAIGATVLERRRVGEGALVSAGALVTRDVEPHVQVMGVPAQVAGRGVTGYAASRR
jgi:sugar O-acyltransferase (sialic acid O-acetyltransferase NeuD family)